MTKLVKAEETMFCVHAPPHVGHYKLEIYAASVPKTKGKLNLPIVATFMVEGRLKSHEAVLLNHLKTKLYRNTNLLQLQKHLRFLVTVIAWACILIPALAQL